MSIKKYFINQSNHLWCSSKVCNEVATIDCNQYPYVSPNTTKKHDHFPLWHTFTHYCNHLQIARLVCLCVDFHVGLILWLLWLWINKLGGINVEKKIIHQPKIGCLGNSGFNIFASLHMNLVCSQWWIISNLWHPSVD